jgi:hypothetical protein
MSAETIGQLLGGLIFSFVESLLRAFFVQLATNFVCHFTPTYRSTYIACLIGSFAHCVMIVIGLDVIPLFVIGFFISSGINGIVIKHPESGSIGFRKACHVLLLIYSVGGFIGAVIWFILSLLFS